MEECYNKYRFTVRNSNLEEAIMRITEMFRSDGYKPVEIVSNSCDSIERIINDPHYIQTEIEELNFQDNAQFILISAPGAVGKSALAKYIAYKTQGLYWDLSKLTIGDHTFLGTMFESVGLNGIDSYIKGLSNGDTTLIIDAFDEAEMISGRTALENLIKEIYEKATPQGTVFLFSRSETANFLSEYMLKNDILFSHYDIQYFNFEEAKEFVLNYLKHSGKNSPNDKWNDDYIESHKKIIEECIDESLHQLENSLYLDADKDTFLGYAPVLETVAINILEESNLINLKNEMQIRNGCFKTVQSILMRILLRERDKVIGALKQKTTSMSISEEFLQNFYSVEDQIKRLMTYIIMDDIDTDLPTTACPKEQLDDLCKACEDILRTFTPQHPFITFYVENKQYDFIGAAFRDYILASALLDPEIEFLAEEYYKNHHGLQSHVFWEQYISKNANTIKSHHFNYVYNAFNSMLTAKEFLEIDIYESEGKTICCFVQTEKSANADDFGFARECSFNVEVTENGFVFNNITNVSINAKVDIHIINIGRDIKIQNCLIRCNALTTDGNNINFENYDNEETQIIANTINFSSRSCNFKIKGNGVLSFYSNNIDNYPKLHRYKSSAADDETDFNQEKFTHMLRSIFIKFRTHSKDMPAKDAEFIDFVILQANPSKQKIFNFMCEIGIFFKEKHLYKINLDNMKKYKISMTALNNFDLEQLNTIYKAYNEYVSK